MAMGEFEAAAVQKLIIDLQTRVADLERKQDKLDLWVRETSVQIEKVVELQRRIASLSGINVRV